MFEVRKPLPNVHQLSQSEEKKKKIFFKDLEVLEPIGQVRFSVISMSTAAFKQLYNSDFCEYTKSNGLVRTTKMSEWVMTANNYEFHVYINCQLNV